MRRILLVDDSPMAREPLARLLAYEGYDVLAASNGLEAIETLRDHPIDLLVLVLIGQRPPQVPPIFFAPS